MADRFGKGLHSRAYTGLLLCLASQWCLQFQGGMEMAVLCCVRRVLYAHVSTSYSTFRKSDRWPNGKWFCSCVHPVWMNSQRIINGAWPWLEQRQFLAQILAFIMYTVTAVNCRGHHASSIVHGLAVDWKKEQHIQNSRHPSACWCSAFHGAVFVVLGEG